MITTALADLLRAIHAILVVVATMPASHRFELIIAGLGNVAEAAREARLATARALLTALAALAVHAEAFRFNSFVVGVFFVFAPTLALADALTLNVALELRLS